ncbi:hypothetical protein [Streptomyces eurythermus]
MTASGPAPSSVPARPAASLAPAGCGDGGGDSAKAASDSRAGQADAIGDTAERTLGGGKGAAAWTGSAR